MLALIGALRFALDQGGGPQDGMRLGSLTHAQNHAFDRKPPVSDHAPSGLL
ncbi:hypothetical protein [Aquibaculum sediminis]|uniref:hypothetical protein n=1 Tax=Aquibaculum sediminis TaxID=3231907 RepID=UPI00345720BA